MASSPDSAEDPPPATSFPKGVALMLAAATCFALSDVFAKKALLRYSGVEVAWFRYAGMAAVLAIAAPWHGLPGRSANPGLQIGRGAGLIGAALFYTLALAALPLAEASAIAFASPVFVTLMSALALRERVDRTGWLVVVAGFVGVLLVMRPGSAAFQPAALFAMASAASWAGAIVFTRKSFVSDSVATTTAYSATIGLAALSVLALPAMPMPTPGEAATLAAMAIIWGFAQWFALSAFHQAEASRLAPFAYLQLVFAIGFSHLIFAHVPDAWAFAGIAVIVASGVIAGVRARRRAPVANRPLLPPGP